MEAWTLDLVVETDESRDLVRPRVRIGGGLPFQRGEVRADLIDRDGRRRETARAALYPGDVGVELMLPWVSAPEGSGTDEVLRWAWDVTVVADGAERIRWRRFVEVGSVVGTDGEIVLAGSAEHLRSKAEEEGWGPEAPWDVRDSERLLDALVGSGDIGEADRKAVMAEAAATGASVEAVLVDQGLLDDRSVLAAYAQVTGCELVDLDTHPVHLVAADRIPPEAARRWGCVGIAERGGMLTVAMCDPQDPVAVTGLQRLVGPVYIVLATRDDVLRAIDRAEAER